MRIIKHGRDPSKPDPMQAKCVRCRTVFEFTSDEASMSPDPREPNYYVIACPVCGSNVMKEIPRVPYY